MSIAVLFTMAKLPINREDEKAVVYAYNGMLLSHKKEGSLTICDSTVDLEGIILRETSQSEKDKHHRIF